MTDQREETGSGLRLAGLIAEQSALLEEVGIDSALAEVEWILCHLLGVERLQLYLEGEQMIDQTLIEKLDKIITRRRTRYPLQFILNEAWFYGRKFFVNESVMAPTPETERLIEIALDFCKHRSYDQPKILDMGVGSGVISLTIASELPKAKIVAVDISKQALDVARKNASDLGVADRVEFRPSDFFEKIDTEERFDLILSNPPYIAEPDYPGLDPEVLADPKIAMTAGDEGMDAIKVIVAEAPKYLAKRGRIFFEIGYNQAEKVARLTDSDQRYHAYALFKDLSEINRVIMLGCDSDDS